MKSIKAEKIKTINEKMLVVALDIGKKKKNICLMRLSSDLNLRGHMRNP